MVIGGLKPDTTYSITVAAYTTKGDGARSKPKLVVTKGAGQCNHTLFSVMARLDDYCFFCYSDGRICSSHLRPEGRSGPEVFTQVLFHPTQKCVCHRAPRMDVMECCHRPGSCQVLLTDVPIKRSAFILSLRLKAFPFCIIEV